MPEGDEEGEFTFIGGVGNSVIDYVVANETGAERMRSMKVKARIDSGHAAIKLDIEGKREATKRSLEKK